MHRSTIQITFVCVLLLFFLWLFVRFKHTLSYVVFSSFRTCELDTYWKTLKHFTASATRLARLRFFVAQNKRTDWKFLVTSSEFYKRKVSRSKFDLDFVSPFTRCTKSVENTWTNFWKQGVTVFQRKPSTHWQELILVNPLQKGGPVNWSVFYFDDVENAKLKSIKYLISLRHAHEMCVCAMLLNGMITLIRTRTSTQCSCWANKK